jgi:hypothetical protein
VKDRYAVVTATDGVPLSRHRTLASAAEWISSREQEAAVEVKAVDLNRPPRLRPLSARDRGALQRLLYPALYDPAADPDAKADAAGLRGSAERDEQRPDTRRGARRRRPRPAQVVVSLGRRDGRGAPAGSGALRCPGLLRPALRPQADLVLGAQQLAGSEFGGHPRLAGLAGSVDEFL